MNKSNIEWCDYTWNPTTGCLHECSYCYARDIARRFGGMWVKGIEPLDSSGGNNTRCGCGGLHEINEPQLIKAKGRTTGKGVHMTTAPFPYGFCPTFHRYRLSAPQKATRPKTIFVGSMADIFGQWVPDEWIQEIFRSCDNAPQHRYLFLTKNPIRYTQPEIHNFGNVGTNALHHNYPDNWWFGTTITNQTERDSRMNRLPFYKNCFVSIEPLTEEVPLSDRALRNQKYIKWVIIGAETGNRNGKVLPKREWIQTIVDACRNAKVPVFLKNNLRDIWGDSLIQEFPWSEKVGVQ